MAGNINSGRKSKEVEQDVLEKLSVLDDLFFSKLEEAMKQGKPYAMRLFATHRIPKPTMEIHTKQVEDIPLFNIIYKSTEEIEAEHSNKLKDSFIDTLDIDIENQLIM